MNLILSKTFKHCKLKTYNIQRLELKTSAPLYAFWERDEKGGYADNRKLPPRTQMIREGFKELKNEIALWSQEMKEKFECDPIMQYRAGETDIVWSFESPNSLERWITTSDSDNNEGKSKCDLTVNKYGNGVFSGTLNQDVPKDGVIKRAGYCNMRTIRARKSFKRDSFVDWSPYNILVLKVRGDGRSYVINITTKGFFDLTWNDTYHYVLYTRGGPYWQISKIPFSKFFFSSKGRVQDRQAPIPLNRVTHFGISMADKIKGDFSLEIDYIGVEYNPNHTEEFAYEMYQTEKFIAAT